MADRIFEFDLIFTLPEGADDEDAILDSLYEAGCDDAVVGLGRRGSVGVAFVREGRDAEAVVARAIGQAVAGLPAGAVLEEVRPDAVSLAEGLSRRRRGSGGGR